MTVIALVALLLCGIGGLVARSLWQQHKRDVAHVGLDFLPGVSQHIQDFHRVKVQDGRKVWEVAADDAQYKEEDETVIVHGAALQLFLKDGRILGLKSNDGQILLAGREMISVDLTGAIQATLTDYVMRTERATYDHQQRIVSAPGAVEISGRAFQVRGDSMTVDVNAERLTLQHNVSMQIQPGLLKQGGRDAPL
ncbi:MAG TPA: LPS export ABC transporter periplasmic protein LptC [Candidatus Margulisiibacteriota bacterium]|nr:LPS export ABC transporter periplasmic protein LptC [Candidatus Margulisiibacteriota bacterium]